MGKKEDLFNCTISVGIVTNIQRVAKYIGLKLKKQAWDREIFGRHHHIQMVVKTVCVSLSGRIHGMRIGSRRQNLQKNHGKGMGKK